MKKLLSIAVAAAFAASSLAAVAQDKKKQDVKSAQGTNVTTPGKAPVTTATEKPKNDKKGAVGGPEFQGKRKTEAERMEKKK
jgi:Ni/Co efflux regulator RcnB